MKLANGEISMGSVISVKIDDAIICVVIVLLIALLVYRHLREEPAGLAANQSEREQLGIYQLINDVRNDLEKSDEARIREGKAPLFRVDSFDLDINFVVNDTKSANAEARFEVLSVGGKREISAEKVQKITLRMKAIERGGPGSMRGTQEYTPVEPRAR